jgi:hypothetical protein
MAAAPTQRPAETGRQVLELLVDSPLGVAGLVLGAFAIAAGLLGKFPAPGGVVTGRWRRCSLGVAGIALVVVAIAPAVRSDGTPRPHGAPAPRTGEDGPDVEVNQKGGDDSATAKAGGGSARVESNSDTLLHNEFTVPPSPDDRPKTATDPDNPTKSGGGKTRDKGDDEPEQDRPIAPKSKPNTLRPGERLSSGQYLVSGNDRYVALLQNDGNLVVIAEGNRPIWATGTAASEPVLINQEDGNVVLVAKGNRPVWASGTDGHPGTRLVMQSDGNLVAYRGRQAVWASGTS